jgi:hypothetical protein
VRAKEPSSRSVLGERLLEVSVDSLDEVHEIAGPTNAARQGV